MDSASTRRCKSACLPACKTNQPTNQPTSAAGAAKPAGRPKLLKPVALLLAHAGVNGADGPDVSWITSMMTAPVSALPYVCLFHALHYLDRWARSIG